MYNCELKFVMKQSYNEPYIVNLHRHPCYEIVFYIKGNGHTVIDKTKYEFKENTFSFTKPNQLHNEVGNENVEVIYIGFNVINDSINFANGIYDNDKFNILEDLYNIYNEMNEQKAYYERMLNIYSEQILIKIHRGLIEGNKKEEDQIHFIQNFIKLNCMKNLKIKALADTFGFNYDYFRRKFKEKTGTSIKEYILDEKINYTIDLLKNSKFSIKEIADMAGFASPSHFIIVFKEKMKMTPKEYLKAYESEEKHKEIADYDGNMPMKKLDKR